jgi:hypothetical protein
VPLYASARKLTPAEKREKKMRKLFDDASTSGETQVHVYRVESMANPKNKFRVDINAQENKLAGESSFIFTLGFIFIFLFVGVFPFWFCSFFLPTARHDKTNPT